MAKVGNRTLAGMLGSAAAASLLVTTLTVYEGKKNVGYRDPAGIPTKCMGDTKDVVVGKFYTDEQCRNSLEQQAISHLSGVVRCTPKIKGMQLLAAGSFAYNVGETAYCRGLIAKKFNAGDLKGGCAAFTQTYRDKNGKVQIAYTTARGIPLRGLVVRRQSERKLCEQDLPK